MTPDARGLLPAGVAAELLKRWAEPHRHYHGTSHLVCGLQALEQLGGSRLERIAFWFHDAVHTNTTPADETASAALSGDMMSGHLSTDELTEVQRLVMLTAGHHTDPGDVSGQRICDADLSGLGADQATYQRNVAGIRAELPHLNDVAWVDGRSQFLAHFLERDRFFATDAAHTWWERQARANMQRELSVLRIDPAIGLPQSLS